MDNDKFQELVINQFGEIQNQFGKVFKKLEDHDARFDRLEVFAKQHHEELKLVARQIETREIKDISGIW